MKLTDTQLDELLEKARNAEPYWLKKGTLRCPDETKPVGEFGNAITPELIGALALAVKDLKAELEVCEDIIHWEFCSSECHPFCTAVSSGLAKHFGGSDG